jgi:hypothetical protein
MATSPLPVQPLPHFIAIPEWQGWISVPKTKESPQTPAYLKTDVGLAAVADVFPTTSPAGYKYQCALALVNQEGQVYVNFMSWKFTYEDGVAQAPVPDWLFPSWIRVLGEEVFRTKLALSAVVIGSELYLYAVSEDIPPYDANQVYYTSTGDGQNWSGWKKVRGGAKRTNLAVCAAPDGTLYLVDSGGTVWMNSNPTTPSGVWSPVAPGDPFSTDAGVCACVGNSQSFPYVGNSPTACTLVCNAKGQENDIHYLSPNAQAWQPLPPQPAPGQSIASSAATASAPIAAEGEENPGCSLLFLTGPNRDIYVSAPFFPDAGQVANRPDSIYRPTLQLGWDNSQLAGFRTDAALAAAVTRPVEMQQSEGPTQYLFLFAKGLTWGDVKMNYAWISYQV